MESAIETVFARINKTLDEVVAQEIDSDFVRGQVYAIMDLLNQLQPRIEYRRDLLTQEIEWGRETLALLAAALEQAGIELPSNIAATADTQQALDAMSGVQLRKERDAVDTAVSGALDVLDAHRAAIVDVEALEYQALTKVQRLISRNLGLVRPMRLDKISRSEKKDTGS